IRDLIVTGVQTCALPIFEESFGIPLVEAMARGLPVAAARLPAHGDYFMPYEEICGDAAEYFDAFDAASCADAVARAIQPERTARSEERRGGKEARRRGRQ